MAEERKVPRDLQIVALLFLIGGIGSAIHILLGLVRGSINLDFGVLGIPMFFGLRSFSRGWRALAMFSLMTGMILLPIFVGWGLSHPSSGTWTVLGVTYRGAPALFSLLLAPLAFLLLLWQYRVLARPDIRALFQLAPVDGGGDIRLREQ
jgi:hypothetical protein